MNMLTAFTMICGIFATRIAQIRYMSEPSPKTMILYGSMPPTALRL
jgi:hypothetical protein